MKDKFKILYDILSDKGMHDVKLRKSHHGYELYQGLIFDLPRKLIKLQKIGWLSYYDCRYIRFHYFPKNER